MSTMIGVVIAAFVGYLWILKKTLQDLSKKETRLEVKNADEKTIARIHNLSDAEIDNELRVQLGRRDTPPPTPATATSVKSPTDKE